MAFISIFAPEIPPTHGNTVNVSCVVSVETGVDAKINFEGTGASSLLSASTNIAENITSTKLELHNIEVFDLQQYTCTVELENSALSSNLTFESEWPEYE